MRHRALLLTAVLAVATSACDDGGMTGPEGDGVIEGRIESTVAAEGGTTASAAQELQATEVAVARVGSGGSLEVLADAAVDGSTFRIEGVPAGRTSLVVVARAEGGAEVGRALVHGETEADDTLVVAPINPETTVEGTVFAALMAGGHEEAARNTGGLAAFVRMSDAEAEATLTSSTQLEAVADAFAASESALTAAFDAMGVDLDARARADLTTSLARQFASQRNDGANLDLAHEAMVEAILSAYAASAGSDAGVSLAGATAASAAAHASADIDEATQVAVLRQSLSVHLRARERLAATASSFPGGVAAANALAQARVSLSADGTMAEVQADLDAARAGAQSAILGGVLDLLSSFSLSVRNGVQAEILSAFQEADLAGRLEGRTSAQAMADVLAGYRDDVEAAAGEVTAEVPAGVSFDADALVRILLAAGGSAWIS